MAGILERKVALVTGGASGIGRATALAMAREGARVAVADRTEDSAAGTVALINAAGGQAIAIGGDVTREADVAAMLTRTISAFGRIDCAFNNAGISGYQVGSAGQKTADWSEDAFDRMIAVNLKGVWLAMRAEIEVMAKQGGGAIVNTASTTSRVGIMDRVAYVTSKGAVAAMTRAMALDHAHQNIRINAIAPGTVESPYYTDILKKAPDPQALRQSLAARQPMNRMGTPLEIANAVVYLASDEASFCTGPTLFADGGWTAR